MSTAHDGNTNVSSPRPLMKRSKSMATSLRKPGTSRPSSVASSSTQFSNSGMSMMQMILKALNTPISDAGTSARSRSSLSDRSSVFSRLRRGEDKPTDGEAQLRPILRLRSASHLRDTTKSLLSDYSTFRSSVMSASTRMDTEEILEAADNYYSSMKRYLTLVDDLPSSVRDTLEVKRLRQQLQFTVELLQPVVKDNQNEQTILLLDNTLMLVKGILTDVQNLLQQQMNPPSPISEEGEGEDDASPTEVEQDYDIPEGHLALLMAEASEDEDGPKAEPKSIRRMRSSMAFLGGSSEKRNSSSDSGVDSNDDADTSHQLTQHSDRTQETLVELSRNIEAVADSLIAFKEYPFFVEYNNSEITLGEPVDTVDITYGSDGIPVAMSRFAIFEQLIKDLGTQPLRMDMPYGNFGDVIFTTFRFFWESTEFLQYLEGAYDDSYCNDRKLSIVLVARTWVLAYWLPEDTREKGLIENIHRFLGKALTDGIVSARIVLDILFRLEEYATDPQRSAITRKLPKVQFESMPWRVVDITRDVHLLQGSYDGVSLRDFNNRASCLEFAKQITLKESALHLNLTATDVISVFVNAKEDKNEDKLREAKEKMGAVRDFSCLIKRWAEWNVLRVSSPLKRAKTIAFLMRLAKACLEVRNFSSAHSIYNGALSVHLDILYQTDAELTPKARKNIEHIEKFFNENKEISMQSSAQPTIPIMATYAGKLTRLSEVKGIETKSKVDESVTLINISYLKTATRITYAMESNQNPYTFKIHAPLRGYLDYTLGKVPDDDEIRARYLQVKDEELNGVCPIKPAFFRRLRVNSTVVLPKF